MTKYNDKTLKGYNPKKDILIEYLCNDDGIKKLRFDRSFEPIFENEKYLVKENPDTNQRIYEEKRCYYEGGWSKYC